MFDWANSPFPAIVLTFVIPAYFAQAVVGDAAQATELWAVMTGLILNVTAGLGAFAFGWVDDRIGAKRTILIGIAGIIAVGAPLLMVESKLAFMGPWVVALVTAATDSQRWGMTMVLPFLVVGGVLLLIWVRDVPGGGHADAAGG